jgi:hypothetical protein
VLKLLLHSRKLTRVSKNHSIRVGENSVIRFSFFLRICNDRALIVKKCKRAPNDLISITYNLSVPKTPAKKSLIGTGILAIVETKLLQTRTI